MDARTSTTSLTRKQKYPIQLVDVVLPRFQAKVADPKTKHVTLVAIQKALKARKIKFNAESLAEMFNEADFEGLGYLTHEHLKAALTGRYSLRKYKLDEWSQLFADVLGTSADRLDPAMDMSLTHKDIARRRAKAARELGAFQAPLPPASPMPTSRPTSAHSGRIAIEARVAQQQRVSSNSGSGFAGETAAPPANQPEASTSTSRPSSAVRFRSQQPQSVQGRGQQAAVRAYSATHAHLPASNSGSSISSDLVSARKQDGSATSRPSSAVRFSSQLQQEMGQRKPARHGASASSAALRTASFTSSGGSKRTTQDYFTAAVEGDNFDASVRLHPQFQEYLAAMDNAYGQENRRIWSSRNEVPKAAETPSDKARRTLSLASTYPFDDSKPPSSLARTRQALLGIKPKSKPLVDVYHRPLNTHHLDRNKQLGMQIDFPDVAQTFPRRPAVVQTGLPKQDYLHVSSHAPPPQIFGCQMWWN